MEIKEVVVRLQDLQNSSDHTKAEYSYDLLFIQNVLLLDNKLKLAYLAYFLASKDINGCLV